MIWSVQCSDVLFEVALQAWASNLAFPSINDGKINVYRHNNNNTQIHPEEAKKGRSVLASEGVLSALCLDAGCGLGGSVNEPCTDSLPKSYLVNTDIS